MNLTITANSNVHGIRVPNILEDDALHAYFDLKAELAYHCSMPTRKMKRDRYDVTAAHLARWFALEQSRRHSVLDEYVVKRRARKVVRVLDIWDKADEFFSRECLASLDSLKAAYRKAAFVCHPDTGGNHEDMVALNQTFTILHETVTSTNLSIETTANDNGAAFIADPISFSPNRYYASEAAYFSSPMSRDELIAAYYLHMQVDIFDLESALIFIGGGSRFPMALCLIDDGKPSHLPLASGMNIARASTSRSVAIRDDDPLLAQDLNRIRVLETVQILFQRCYGLGRADLCRDLVSVIDKIIENVRKATTNVCCNSQLDPILTGINDVMEARVKSRIVLTHDRQELNARRLAAYELGRRKRKSVEPNPEDSIPGGIKLIFSKLRYDPRDSEQPRDSQRIPYPGWISGPPSRFYSRAQAWEYHEAFYRVKSRRLVEKHLMARAWAFILSLVLSKVKPRPMLEEMSAVAALFPSKLHGWTEFCDYCKGLSAADLLDRIATLRRLHKNMARKLGGRDAPWFEGGEFIVGIDNRYFEVAMTPIDRLHSALRTGSTKTSKELAEERLSVDAMGSFFAQHENRIYDLFDGNRQKNPTEVATICSSYIDACLNFAPQTEHVEEFQICWWFNELTVALAKQGQWQLAKERIEQMLSLPARFSKRSGDAEQEALKRRLARCQKKCVKSSNGERTPCNP